MTYGQQNLNELEDLSKQAAEAILENDSVKIISHNDADGLTAAGIMCNSLHRKGILFQLTIVGQFDQSTLDMIEKTSSGSVILCDMGSGQAELASKLKDAIIIDHHKPTGKLDHVQFNPHLVGIDGSTQLCASCSTYLVACQIGDNSDLAGLAIAGAVGDKQQMKGANKHILDEAVSNKIITLTKGLRLGDGPLEEVFENSVDPYLDITGDRDKIESFLDQLGIKGELQDLSDEDMTRLSSALILKLVKQGSIHAVDSLIGENYRLNNELVKNIYDFVNIMNACGKDNKSGIALSLCMHDSTVLNEAKALAREHQRTLISTIKKAQENIRSVRSFRYLLLEESSGTGIIAGTMTRYLYPDKPFLTFNEVEGKIRISGRGTRKLVEAGLDLASAMSKAAEMVGGTGGGHDVASGAMIPKGSAIKFIEYIDPIIEEQLKPKS